VDQAVGWAPVPYVVVPAAGTLAVDIVNAGTNATGAFQMPLLFNCLN
jgi:hypothetical protein